MSNHSHYFKDVSHLETIDVYRVLDLFGVTNPAIAHATKKLLCAGIRGAGKCQLTDIQEAIDSLERCKVMINENDRPSLFGKSSTIQTELPLENIELTDNVTVLNDTVISP